MRFESMQPRNVLLLALQIYLCLLMACLAPCVAIATTPAFWELESKSAILPTDTLGVSDDGSAILSYQATASGAKYGIWQLPDNTVRELPINTLAPYRATTISPDGNDVVIIASLVDSAESQWWRAGSYTALEPLAPGLATIAFQIIADGSGVVGYAQSVDGTRAEAVVWNENGVATRLNEASGFDVASAAIAASADGSIIVGTTGTSAAIWNADHDLRLLGTLPGHAYSGASSVTADGKIVVGNSVPPSTGSAAVPFIWSDETGMESLGSYVGLPETYASDISADGRVIVGTARDDSLSGSSTAIIMLEGRHWLDLKQYLENKFDLGEELSGWRLEQARSVSADGRTIIGFGFGPEGENRGWAATIPEPRSGRLLAICLAMAVSYSLATSLRRTRSVARACA